MGLKQISARNKRFKQPIIGTSRIDSDKVKIGDTSILLAGGFRLCVRAGASGSATVSYIFRVSLRQDHRADGLARLIESSTS